MHNTVGSLPLAKNALHSPTSFYIHSVYIIEWGQAPIKIPIINYVRYGVPEAGAHHGNPEIPLCTNFTRMKK